MAAPAGHPHVAHAPAAFGSLPGRRTNAGLPADLGAAGPQWMTERAKLGLVFENRYWHANAHAPAGGVSLLRVVLRRLSGVACVGASSPPRMMSWAPRAPPLSRASPP